MKTVSVVMCTYNGAKYLREQLDSIISQTYPIYELIVQDDCSTDETVAIIKEYMEKYSFIKLYVNEHNLGFNLNFKSVCMKATGDFVALSDQDDVWFPDKIQKQVNMIAIQEALLLRMLSYLQNLTILRGFFLKITFLAIPCYANVLLFKTKDIGLTSSGMTGHWHYMLLLEMALLK